MGSSERLGDVALVGGGMACLAAAASLAKNGHRVTVIEQRDRVGGCFSGFVNEAGDRFDLAVSHLLGADPDGSLTRLLAELELEDVALVPTEVADSVTLSGRRYLLPTGLDALEAELGAQMPEQRAELARFLAAMRTFMGGGRDSGAFMMKNYKRSFEEFCRTSISDDALRNLLAMRIQCDESSFMVMSGFFTECYGKGMVYPSGGVAALVDRVRERIEQHGGIVRTGVRATDLEIRDGQAEAVVLEDGERVAADVVLHGGSAAALDAILRRHDVNGLDLEGRRVGHSSLSIFLTLEHADLSRFDGPARHYLTDTTDVFETYRTLETGHLPDEPVIKLHFMTRIDPTLAAPGRELVRVEVDMYHLDTGHDRAFYNAYAEEILARVERGVLPELADSVVYRRVVTPIDYEQWFGHEGGSATGWAHDVENLMSRRFPQRTPLANVFVTGQWGEYGSGLPQLLASAQKSVALARRTLTRQECA